MPSPPCPTCNSTMGYYPGPNNVPRCLNCFHDTTVDHTAEDPNVSPEPNTQVDDKAEPGPKSVKGTAQDKAVRGPKEPKR